MNTDRIAGKLDPAEYWMRRLAPDGELDRGVFSPPGVSFYEPGVWRFSVCNRETGFEVHLYNPDENIWAARALMPGHGQIGSGAKKTPLEAVEAAVRSLFKDAN